MGARLAYGRQPASDNSILEVPGRGLLRAVRFDPELSNARDVQDKCREMGLIVNALGDDRLRLAPPLNVTADEVDRACEVVRTAVRRQ